MIASGIHLTHQAFSKALNHLGTGIKGPVGRLAAYALITVTAAVATFATTLVLVRVLGLEGFGAWSLVEPLIISISSFALLGVESGILKMIAHERLSLQSAVGRVLPFTFVVLLLVSVIAGIFVPGIARISVSPTAIGGVIFAESCVILLLTACRASDWVISYGALQIGRTGINFAAILAFATVLGTVQITTPTLVWIRSGIGVFLAVVFLMVVKPVLRWDWSAYRMSLQYGLFVVITSALTAILENYDRYIVAEFHDQQTVGAYVISLKMAAIVGQGITMPLMMWFPSERFRHLKDPDRGQRFFAITALLILGLLLLVSGCVFLFGRSLSELIVPGATYSPSVLLLLLAAMTATSMAHPLNIGLLIPGKSHLNLYPATIAVVSGMMVARLVVPAGGLVAAAGAKLFSLVAALTLIYVLSQRVETIDFRLPRLFALCIVAGLSLWLLSFNWAAHLHVAAKAIMYALVLAGTCVGMLFRDYSQGTVTFAAQVR